MSGAPEIARLGDDEVEGLVLAPGGEVDVRRDLSKLVSYVREKGILRTKRENRIPKAAARQLAKKLSYAGELEAIEEDGGGYWSDWVSHLARAMGLVTFDVEGEYEGYTSAEPSFPDNRVEINEELWSRYLAGSALEKEQALLETSMQMTPNELFNHATLVSADRFDSMGCAIGPVSRMDLFKVRRGLLELLTELEPDVWYDARGAVDWLEARAPHLILDPDLRGPDRRSQERLRDWEWEQTRRRRGKKKPPRPEVQLEDIYWNFRERPVEGGRVDYQKERRQLSSDTPDAFHRVEGRYLTFFLSEIPYLHGFVSLAFRSHRDPHGCDVSPFFERLRAFRLSRRFFQVMGKDPAFDGVKVTVLPTFEVLVEAPSYPEQVLETLEPFTRPLGEEGPLHKLRIDRKKVVESAAHDPGAAPPARVLESLAGRALPANVATELSSWSKRGEKVAAYEGFGLLELHGGEAEQGACLDGLGDAVVERLPGGFAIVRHPARVMARLEEQHLVPRPVSHKEGAFAPSVGKLGAAAPKKKAPRKRRPKVALSSEDLRGYRVADAVLFKALRSALEAKAEVCYAVPPDLLVLSPADLPALRTALRRLSKRFEISLDGTHISSEQGA
jgi:hypothetical protein